MNRLVVPAALVATLLAPRPAATQTTRVELDHVFVVVSPGAIPEIAALRAAGLNVLTEPNKHDGQGTASVAAFFENAYLELIWIDSTVAVKPEHAQTFRWFQAATAWRTSGQSPYGLGLHRLAGDTSALPVPIRREPAPWLGPTEAYELLHQPSDTLAADLFVVPAVAAVPHWMPRLKQRRPEELRHPGGGREITLVRVYGREEQQPVALTILRPRGIQFERASAPLLEVHIGGGVGGQRVDLRPILPVVLVR